ncbi:hypothetical protein GCM10023350_30270 [Nocardioides endophyticus]|uniref:DUF222 domain-containing protein n=1 Tax=Nocardioides endophyticus TaxID=1353775 RepID=A0ABP8Z153_9ACTN
MQIDHVTALAQQAADLLPAPPRDGDVDSYLSWRELVWSTAARLGEIAGPGLAPSTVGASTTPGAKVTAQELLELAGIAGPGRTAERLAEHRPAHDCGARRVRRTVGTRLA